MFGKIIASASNNALDQLNIEDILMYSLEHNIIPIVKECLLKLKNAKELSLVCQVRLVITNILQATINNSNGAAQLSNENMLLVYAQVLRGLQFIRKNYPKVGGCIEYSACALKLKKLIIMHLICNEYDRNSTEAQLIQQFSDTSAELLDNSGNNLRLANVLKRQINKFRNLAFDLLRNPERKACYMRDDMWIDFNDDFWRCLQADKEAYLSIIRCNLPVLKLEEIMGHEKTFSSAFQQNLIFDCMENSLLNEKELQNLLHLIHERSLSTHVCNSISPKKEFHLNKDTPASKTEHTIPAKTFYGEKIVLKQLSVLLVDFKKQTRRKSAIKTSPRTDKKSKRRLSTLVTHEPEFKKAKSVTPVPSCNVGYKDWHETTEKENANRNMQPFVVISGVECLKNTEKAPSLDLSFSVASSQDGCSYSADLFQCKRDLKHESSNVLKDTPLTKTQCPSVLTNIIAQEMNTNNNSPIIANVKRRRKLCYDVATEVDRQSNVVISSSNDVIGKTNLLLPEQESYSSIEDDDEYVSESDCSDAESVILGADDPHIPDFMKFLSDSQLDRFPLVIVERSDYQKQT